jgi:hypothetical protein
VTTKLGKALAAVGMAGAMAGGLLMFSTATASAGAWSCSVPPGMTWDWVTYDANCGVPNGVSYDVIAPAEGVWACSVPVGWNWTATQVSTLCALRPGPASTAYQLTKAGR